MRLLPVKYNGTTDWKIWILSTYVEGLEQHPEQESLLPSPGRQLDAVERFETDAFIIGGGNAYVKAGSKQVKRVLADSRLASAITLAARLKALGVDSVMAERNASPGDNWSLRYDCMRFHVPTSLCELPYMCEERECLPLLLLSLIFITSLCQGAADTASSLSR
jgi:hypothetical protein